MKTRQKIAVIGLGYVGLPLAAEFGKVMPCVGFDIDQKRIDELSNGLDRTLEVDADELKSAKHLSFTTNAADIADCDTYIVTVPTPVNDAKAPDLSFLIKASETIGKVLKKDDLVIYECTVYPGATEQDVMPHLERVSGLKYKQDFHLGYSPERINPGDKSHRLPDILKITSGSTPEVADAVDALYKKIITAGTYKASNIMVAEAAKVIENTQRDVNIALMNELSLIFAKLDIDTSEVLAAAGTKWNFLKFYPGLVGGHCIGVDPYYLTHKAMSVGIFPEVISAGRRINDSMGEYIANSLVKAMIKNGAEMLGARVLVMGITFKENCPDLRNTRVIDIVHHLESFGIKVDIHDPQVDKAAGERELGIQLKDPETGAYDAIVLAVAHDEFKNSSAAKIKALGKKDVVFFDVKGVFGKEEADFRL